MSKSQQGYCPIQAELFVPFLSPPWSCFSSALPLSSHSRLPSSLRAHCSLRALLARTLITFPTFWLKVPTAVFSAFSFSFTFKPATCILFASFPSSAPSSIHVRPFQRHYVDLCVERVQQNSSTTCFFRLACPLCSIRTDGHMDRRTHGQTDTRTHGQTNFR